MLVVVLKEVPLENRRNKGDKAAFNPLKQPVLFLVKSL
jgi:hypothetical protein